MQITKQKIDSTIANLNQLGYKIIRPFKEKENKNIALAYKKGETREFIDSTLSSVNEKRAKYILKPLTIFEVEKENNKKYAK
jgi:hypothetical protein